MRFIYVIITFLTLHACTEQANEFSPETPELLAYFPIEKGFFRDYEVRETRYFTSTDIEVRTFQIRELYSEPELNIGGGVTYPMLRYKRMSSVSAWELDSLWSSRFEPAPFPRIVQVENNFPYIKMVNPLREGVEWDGNGLNGKVRELYTYSEKIPSYNFQNRTFQDCIFVSQIEDDDEITVREIRFEVYARGRGMVHRNVTKFRYCSRPACLGQKIIEEGIMIEMVQIGYGKI